MEQPTITEVLENEFKNSTIESKMDPGVNKVLNQDIDNEAKITDEVKGVKISLIVLMGLPASGKSSLASQIRQFLSTKIEEVIHFNFDQFVPLSVQSELSEMKILRTNFLLCLSFVIEFLRHCKSSNQTKFQENSKISEMLIKSSHPVEMFVKQTQELVSGIDLQKSIYYFVIDDNNYYKSMRNSFYQIAKNSCLSFTILHLSTPVEECLRRNSKRGDLIPPEVIQSMSEKQELPDPMTSPCDTYAFSIQTPNGKEIDEIEFDKEMIQLLLRNSVQDPLERKIRMKEICGESELHKADIVLRKWVNTQIITSFTTKDAKRQLALSLNERKNELLRKLKEGEMKVEMKFDDVEFDKEILQLVSQIKL